MTLEELWQLFPVFLTEHDPRWAEQYAEEAAALASVLPSGARLYHIGSTAIDGIMAKPIVDIIVEVGDTDVAKRASKALQSCGYVVMSERGDRISLNKGYTEDGFADKVFHVHIRLSGDVDEIYFRDFLNAHHDVAREYEKLKLRLWKEYEHDRDAYTEAKSEFVNKYTKIAKQLLS